jgi:hypothetical protein
MIRRQFKMTDAVPLATWPDLTPKNSIIPKSVLGAPNAIRVPLLSVPIPTKSAHLAIFSFEVENV